RDLVLLVGQIILLEVVLPTMLLLHAAVAHLQRLPARTPMPALSPHSRLLPAFGSSENRRHHRAGDQEQRGLAGVDLKPPAPSQSSRSGSMRSPRPQGCAHLTTTTIFPFARLSSMA